MDFNTIAILGSLFAAFSGLTEWRIRTMQSQFSEKIKDREELTKYKINELQEDIGRLETKIDQLITIQLERAKKYDERQGG